MSNGFSRPLLIGVGGFLGAGKTTSIVRVARRLRAAGRRVAIITNDQASGLVDTAAVRAALGDAKDIGGASVSEIAGGCFCCRFDDLASTLRRIVDSVNPDVIFAEAVGSCTDLAATVYQPLAQLELAPVRLGPLTVVVDAVRARTLLQSAQMPGLPATVSYLYDRQLAEADVLLLNKTDLLSEEDAAALRASLSAQYPGIPVLPVTALADEGMEAWLALLRDTQHAGERVLDLDYDRYADAEAALGWLNLEGTLPLPTGNGTSAAWSRTFLETVASRARAADAEVAHVKLRLDTAGGTCAANLVGSALAPYVAANGEVRGTAHLVLNARVAVAPNVLQGWVEDALEQAGRTTGAYAETRRVQCFAPARPVPAYRLAPPATSTLEGGDAGMNGAPHRGQDQVQSGQTGRAHHGLALASAAPQATGEIPGAAMGTRAAVADSVRTDSAPVGQGQPGARSGALAAATPPVSRPRQSWRRWQQRTFSGESLRTVALPLGGIGTGTVSLGGRGNLQDWEIFNRPAKGKFLPYTFFAIWAQPEGGESISRVLERQLMPPYAVSHGIPPSQMGGLPRLQEARFTGAYPFGRIAFEDPNLPLEVELEAFNPMEPLDADLSGLPVAVFTWRLRNPGDRPVQATVAFSLCNAVGYDGQATFGNRPTGPFFGGNVNRWTDEGDARGISMTGGNAGTDAPGTGSMAVATPWTDTTFSEHWERAGWFDSLQSFWDDFRADGRLPDVSTAEPTPNGLTDIGTLGLRATIPPGGEVRLPFVLAWHFPNLTNYWNRNSPVHGAHVGNWYTSQHPDAWAVARDAVARLDELEARTRDFQEALFDSTLPPVVLDALSSQMSIIRTTTCLRTEDGAFHAFEGCNDNAGCCPMDCTHVWNYEQALAYLYPSLERTMRETDFQVNTRPNGRMSFRTWLPASSGELWDYKPAADGQMGCVLKLYREWQLSGDTEWLRGLWPQAKRAIEWAWEPGSWDADGDGVMEGEQHNTYDIEFFGPNSMMGSLYLGALKAGALMAEAVGDAEMAARCRQTYESGQKNYDALLWNGEYYEQRVEVRTIHQDGQSREDWHPSPIKPGESEPRYQYGAGCLSDQLLGQWFCLVAGLGHVLPPDRVRAALEAVYRHNWRAGLDNHESCQRTYALNDEAGLLLCSWPRGGRPAYPFPYADEVWTGIEYQVAAHLIYEGMVDEGLRIVEGVRARHDGVRRNPWDEFECGHHYARAMASWSLLPALSGYDYSAIEARLRFAPRLAGRNGEFRCFFTTGEAWGTYSRRQQRGQEVHTVKVQAGQLSLQTLDLLPLRHPDGTPRASIGRSNQPLRRQQSVDGTVRLAFAEQPILLRAGDQLTIRWPE
jgi:non-lysosomal glucosylceramidase